MGRPRAISTLLSLAFLAALALSACGGDGDLLPGSTANQLNAKLDRVRAQVAERDCAGAEAAVSEVSEEIDRLREVDQRLKAALRQGTARLQQLVSACTAEAEAEAEAEALAAAEAEQEEVEAVEAEEEEAAAEEREKRAQREEKNKEGNQRNDKNSAATKKEEQTQPSEETKPAKPPSKSEGAAEGKGPPKETPSGNEPAAGGVAPGAVVE